MPSFKISFEVFCETCGAGLCNQSDTRKSRQRQEDQITVEVCQHCLDAATIPLQERIEEIENEVENLKNKLSDKEDEFDAISWRHKDSF